MLFFGISMKSYRLRSIYHFYNGYIIKTKWLWLNKCVTITLAKV
ncbi:hypothetical protein HMPREF1554_01871 [Porphyromonas gingivalis F0569]|nr:hypothetical protein HMPREF1554_01871 [Porphyromonas gingivalis F0569]ERJ86578.1 hypothetical protein HMPREF1989_01119 [Porphyromonas gingivalis F0566]